METPMENCYNIWNKWDKLKTIVLGDTYKPEFYNGIKDDSVRDVLLKICEETLEDLEYYEKVLKDFGCNVIRPKIDPNDNIMNYVNENGEIPRRTGGVPNPPLFPRDHQFILGNTLFFTSDPTDKKADNPWFDLLNEYNNNDTIDLRPKIMKQMYRNGHPKYGQAAWDTDTIHAPCYTVVGRDIYIDQYDRKINEIHRDIMLEKTPNARLNYLRVGGHSDGSFHTIKPGAILSLKHIQTYENTFPDWEVCYLPDQSWFHPTVRGFLQLKKANKGKWWVPGQEDNTEFTIFVEQWLDNWVGYVEETVFDVNVVVLDEHHVCVNNPNNEQVNTFLKKHKMEPIHVPFRHRYFHDGGLHCLTLDLNREGIQQDYFPNRSDVGVIDHGFD
jgi:hypothetical protein